VPRVLAGVAGVAGLADLPDGQQGSEDQGGGPGGEPLLAMRNGGAAGDLYGEVLALLQELRWVAYGGDPGHGVLVLLLPPHPPILADWGGLAWPVAHLQVTG